MENLTTLQKEVLEILKQLESRCEVFILHNQNKKEKVIPIMFDDIDLRVLQKREHIHDIEEYLQQNRVNFIITFDLENEFPDMYLDKEHPDYRFVQLGEIKGESLIEIHEAILLLIQKISNKKNHRKDLAFNVEKSIFFFLDKEILISERSESDPHYLMETLFKDREKVWHSDEILEDWKFCLDSGRTIPKNKVYQAGKKINNIIAQATTVADFLEVTTKYVKINSKYL